MKHFGFLLIGLLCGTAQAEVKCTGRQPTFETCRNASEVQVAKDLLELAAIGALNMTGTPSCEEALRLPFVCGESVTGTDLPVGNVPCNTKKAFCLETGDSYDLHFVEKLAGGDFAEFRAHYRVYRNNKEIAKGTFDFNKTDNNFFKEMMPSSGCGFVVKPPSFSFVWRTCYSGNIKARK